MQLSILLFSIIFFIENATALDFNACSKMMNDGWYGKYEYGGIDQPLTKATKKHGSSKGTSVTSTEGSTATFDPGYTTNVYTSQTQYISSWGDCSAIALKRIKDVRDKYFSQNREEILKEFSRAEGKHLPVLASYSLCDSTIYPKLNRILQQNTENFVKNSGLKYGKAIDQLIQNHRGLQKYCIDFSQLNI